jgi:dTDP-4-amino-4,6-dideoxygalactose transaminase
MNEVERSLAAYFDRAYCIMCSRATSGIYTLIKGLALKSGTVVLPAIACPSPANAVILAGLKPLFCDINLSDYTIDIDALKKLLAQDRTIRAILPIHLYGFPADMQAIESLAKEYNLPVIEDAAQAMGGSFAERKLGSWGDASVISFGHTKIMDIGSGGAVLTDDRGLYDAVRDQIAVLPIAPPNLSDLGSQYRELYYTIKPLAEKNPRLNRLFWSFPEIFQDLYLHKKANCDYEEITRMLPSLEGSVALRQERAEIYRSVLDHKSIIHPKMTEGSVPWRYTFRVTGGLQGSATSTMRERGFDISNWYPALPRWYASDCRQEKFSYPNAAEFENQVVNLWVSPSVSIDEIEQIAGTFLEVLDHQLQNAMRTE